MTKDPDSTLDYGINWSSWLETGETIATSAWSVSGTGLTVGTGSYAATNTTTTTTVWLTGGTVGTRYLVTNRITTDSSPARTEDRSFQIVVRER